MHDVRSKSPPWGYTPQSNFRGLPDPPPPPPLGLDIDRCIIDTSLKSEIQLLWARAGTDSNYVCILLETFSKLLETFSRKYDLSLARGNLGSKGLFTWKEGVPGNRATRLEGSANSPPLHATHLTGTVGCAMGYLLSGRSPQQTKWPTKETFWRQVQFFYRAFLVYKTVVNGNYEKKFTLHRHVFAVSSASRDSSAGTANLVKSYHAPSRMPRASSYRAPRVGGVPCLACKRSNEFSKKTFEKLAHPG